MAGDGDFCEVSGHGRKFKTKSGQWCPHSDHDGKPKAHNVWKVIATKNGKHYFKRFEGDKPRESGAIDFGKQLQERGYRDVSIVSGYKDFAKPLSIQVPKGLLWCPYCLKVRQFIFKGLRHPDGTHTPALWRCPVCYISIRSAAVRNNNDFLTIVLMDPRAQERKKKIPTEKNIRRNLVGGR